MEKNRNKKHDCQQDHEHSGHHHEGGYIDHYDDDHDHTLMGELMCHLPYAIFSVAMGLAVLSFLGYGSLLHCVDDRRVRYGSMVLFHSFHFMHIVFAATGTLITYFRFSKNVVQGLLVGIVSSSVFCTLSDVILPYLAGSALGVHMHLHLCFLTELHNILPFMIVGLINGFVMSRHRASHQGVFSVFSHFFHILISSLASIFYLVSQGCTDWYANIGIVFLLLIVAVVVPCTLSDVVVPMAFARMGKKDAKHNH